MKFRIFLAIAACRLMRFFLRLFGRGGTALPGKVALKICPELLGHLAKGVSSVVITGTNGKTTTARMVEQLYIDAGARYFANKSGSNLMQGITAEFVLHATLLGRPKCQYAVIECDEAASKRVFACLNPKVLLVTNIFRDQLDRFGEVSTTLANIITGAKNAPEATVILNADDSLASSVAEHLPNPTRYFGVDVEIYPSRAEEISDATHCLHCGGAYTYDYITYGHLGGYRCAACGHKRQQPDVAVTEILAQNEDAQTVRIRAGNKEYEMPINLPGGYNIYNAAGAFATALALGFSAEAALRAIAGFACGFGRMEKLELNGHPFRLILVKNPAGAGQVINYLTNLEGRALFAICLNDNIADGTDISWIWDVAFEKLAHMGEKLAGIYVAGIRADEMALRLKYAGFAPEHLRIFDDYGALLNALLAQDTPVYIMPTYTAMLDLRKIISRRYGLKDFWE